VFQPLSLSHRSWSLPVFVVIAACGGRTSGVSGSGSNVAVSGSVSAGTVSGGSGTISMSASGSTSGTVTSGSVVSSGATSGTVVSVSGTITSSGTVGILPPVGDGGPDSGPALGPIPSAGCGKTSPVATAMWVSQPVGCAQGVNNQGTAACQAIPPGSVVAAKATQGSPEYRGWWVYVPTGYDSNKPYTVIYSAAGWGDPNYFHGGADGFPYQMVDGGNAILVGLDYDTFSPEGTGYDPNDPQSNDLVFIPWLMNEIESTYCVDTTREWISDYGDSENALAEQLDCAFPARFRGQVMVSGSEPGAPGYPGSLPTCHPSPMAAFYVHDINDTDSTYASILPGCSRILQQNGCSNTTCDPSDKTLTTPYPVPAGVNLTISNGTCVKFGCPAEYPVVFCTTNYAPNHHSDDQYMGVVALFWNFINGVAPVRRCADGQGYKNGTCASCASGETTCNDVCANEATDPSFCGGCSTTCPIGGICQSGSCACPQGQTLLNGVCCLSGEVACPGPASFLTCVNPQTDSNNCGGCAVVCPSGTCLGGVCGPCPPGETACGGNCVNEQTDPGNCGACGNLCRDEAGFPMGFCAGGVCMQN
jgi:hypothetical protein